MRFVQVVVLCLCVTSFSLAAQQATPAATSDLRVPSVQNSTKQPERVEIVPIGSEVTAPELIPLEAPSFPKEKCKKKQDGTVEFSFLVDTVGQPRNIMFLKPLGSDLDRMALRFVGLDRFRPATRGGVPVVVAQLVDVYLQSCIVKSTDSNGHKTDGIRLSAMPAQKFRNITYPFAETAFAPDQFTSKVTNSQDQEPKEIGGSVSAPILIFESEARFTLEARRDKLQGICLLSLVVDSNGLPKNIHVAKSLEPGMDFNAISAVNQYRFKPAMKNSVPVPVRINIEVNFRLY